MMGTILSSKCRRSLAAICVAAILGPAVPLVAPSAKAVPMASVARNVSISDKATLLPVGRLGHIINERGSMSGTYSGSVEVQIVRVTNTTGEATITFYTRGGSLKAKATEIHGHVDGAIASFHGSASISGGAGTWAHATGTLTVDGTTDRQNFHTTVEIRGTLHV